MTLRARPEATQTRETQRRSRVLRAAGIVLLICTFTAAAAGCATAAGSGGAAPAIHPDWQRQMEAGLSAWELGRLEAAAQHYRRAVQVARNEGLPSEELAFSTYHLGEAIRTHPETSRGETALALLDESRRHFEASFGTEHPVLIPVWMRIAILHAQAGRRADAATARARADRIAVRFFPESHFLRERYGAARPASILHPIEVLQLMGAWEGAPDRVVQSP